MRDLPINYLLNADSLIRNPIREVGLRGNTDKESRLIRERVFLAKYPKIFTAENKVRGTEEHL